MMLSDDPRLKGLSGGYRLPYDPTAALKRLELEPASAQAWEELFNELHHQGDVGEASYATIPALVTIQRRTRALSWNLYALAATIEIERHRRPNPPLPDWLDREYREAWRDLLEFALADLASSHDSLVIRTAMAVVALARNQREIGTLLLEVDPSEVNALLDNR